jgi:hypothetical protein
MDPQPEAIGKQRSHHEPHLVLRWITFRLRLNLEIVRGCSLRQSVKDGFSLCRREPKLVCEFGVTHQLKIGGAAPVRVAGRDQPGCGPNV